MCSEKSSAAQTFRTVTTTSIQLVGTAPNRRALVISAGINSRITLSIDAAAVDQQGIVIPQNGAPLKLNIRDHGAIVTMGIQAIASAGSNTIAIWETFDLEKSEER